MALKLMYLTANPDIAQIAENAGVDRIFLDLELRGKQERQGNLDTVISHNSFSDVKKVKSVLKKSELLVRVNSEYDGTRREVDSVIEDGADIVMLPYFKLSAQVERFISYVGGRAKTCLLCETPEAVESIDDILSLDGIDEIHIGLNDLHLGYKMKFMFQLVTDGTVDRLCAKFAEKGIPYGFGGVGRLGNKDVPLPAENIVAEHYRLGSQMVILSRSFCDASKISDIKEIKKLFAGSVSNFREFEKRLSMLSADELKKIHEDTKRRVEKTVRAIR